MIAVLVALNAASYTQKQALLDSEFFPNRSTYNRGPTGTKAYFDLLVETGRNPVRWAEPTSALRRADAPSTFVVIGELRRPFQDQDFPHLLRWVSEGGRLVVIDRSPDPKLRVTSSDFKLELLETGERPFFDTDAYDQSQMTMRTDAAKSRLPSTLTQSVNAVQPSRFLSSMTFSRIVYGEASTTGSDYPDGTESDYRQPTPRLGDDEIRIAPKIEAEPELPESAEALNAPVVLIANSTSNVVVKVPYGIGEIVFVTDPYLVSNAGIGVADNALLGLNLAGSGPVAFDEYHQGFGKGDNRFLEFFAGTPVVSMFLQIALLVGLVFLSQSRRFARPVPEPEPDRLSKLEYVSAMAELQQRTKGFDLAIENIYGEFRRRVSRLVGIDNTTARRRDLAVLITERLPDESADEIEAVLNRCDDIMHGDRTGSREVLRLASRIRELEQRLGLQRRKRDRSDKR